LTGSFENIKVQFGDHLTFTSCGVNVRVAAQDDTNQGTTSYAWSFDLFGAGLLSLPGTLVPLAVDMVLTKDGDDITMFLALEGDWPNAFGIRGLTVSLKSKWILNGLLIYELAVGCPIGSSFWHIRLRKVRGL
jgi:hypothetical protein